MYARLKSVPSGLAIPIIAAFLVEYSFYLAPGFAAVRERLAQRFSPHALASLLALSAITPYLIYSLATRQFYSLALIRLALLVAAVAYWYVVRRPYPTSDLAFLAIVAVPLLVRFFDRVYISPIPDLDIDVLGKLMLIRLAATVILTLRGMEGIGFGFIPSGREWRIGAGHFLMFLPIGLPLAMGIGLLRFEPFRDPLWRAAAVFAGMLWVVALSEEFFFRGLLQRWIAGWTGRAQFALITASLLFGFVHLWFRAFPNWRFALLAAVAGWFYGRAYNQGGGIRAAMVAHALTNIVVRTLFVFA